MLGHVELDTKLLLLYIIICDILLYMTAPRSGTCLSEPALLKNSPNTPNKSFPHWDVSFSFTPQCLKTGLLLIPNTFMEVPSLQPQIMPAGRQSTG